MNLLSAIQQYAAPDVRLLPLPKTGVETQGPVLIPFKEIQELPLAINPQPLSPTTAPTESFRNVLGRLVHDVNDKQAAAGETVRGLLGGQNVSLHQAMIAMEEASVSFQLMVEVRNKLLESYQELMRMQI